MDYFLRAIKYFGKVLVVFVAILAILYFVTPEYRGGSIPDMFKDGWKSIAYILGLFAVVSAIRPLIDIKRDEARRKMQDSDSE